MPKKLTTEEFIKKAKEIHGDKYDYSKVTYVNSRTKICIICPEHGEFWQKPSGHLNGYGCSECGKKLRTNLLRSNVDNFIIKAKQVHGDKYDYSEVDYVNRCTKVCIICHEHGEFWQTPDAHFHGNGCPECGKRSRIDFLRSNVDSFIERAKKVHGNKYDYSKVDYVNNCTKVCIICPEHGEFWQTPSGHLNGYGCAKCARLSRILPKDEFIRRARETHGDKYDYSVVEYENYKSHVNIICPIHGFFSQTPHNHVTGKGCPRCSYDGMRLSKDEFIERAKRVHGDKYDYSLTEYMGQKVKVKVVCSEHGEFEQLPMNHLSGNGCPVCFGSLKLTTEEFIERARAIHGDKYDYSKVDYVNSETKVHIICHEHGEFWQNPHGHLTGRSCPKCSLAGTSKTEEKMYELLCVIFCEDDVIRQCKSDVYPFRCDFYVKSRDLYIELNAYWVHGNHWYNEDSEDDVLFKQKWVDCVDKSSAYEKAVYTWTVSDLQKRETARKNNLNYIVFWKDNLSDFEEWIEAGCPDGKDWVCMYSWKKESEV